MGCLVLRRRNENERSREGRRAKRGEKKEETDRREGEEKGRGTEREEEEYAELKQEAEKGRERDGDGTGSNAAKLAASGAMVCGAVKYKPEGEEGQEAEEEKKEEEEEEMKEAEEEKEEWNERGESPLSRALTYREKRCMGRLKCDMRSSLTYKLNVTVVGVSSSLATTAKPHRFRFSLSSFLAVRVDRPSFFIRESGM